jgi:hypothetical protein
MQILREKGSRPKSSRTEKKAKNDSRGLWFVSTVLLVACVTMTGVFGWSQGSNLLNAAILAGGLGMADIGGYYAARYFGSCTAIRDRTGATVAAVMTVICFATTFSGVVGFTGSNREAQAVAREAITKLDANQLEWLRNQTVAVPSKDKATMLAEVKEQFKAMQARGVDAVVAADGLAAVLAPTLKWTEGDARRYTILAFAFSFLFIQYGTSWMYGRSVQRTEPTIAARAMATDRQFVGDKTSIDVNSPVFTKMAAREDLLRLIANDGLSLSKHGVFSHLGRRWGWDVHKVKRFLRSQPDIEPLLSARNQSNVVALNGNGRVHQ